MRYQWDLDEIRTNRKILEEIKKDYDDEYIKEAIDELCQIYTSMILFNSKKTNTIPSEFNYGNNVRELINDTLCFYQEKNEDILNIVLKSIFAVRDNVIPNAQDNCSLAASNEELVNVASNFFLEMTTPEIYKKYKEIISTKGLVNIKYVKDTDYYAGMTYFDSILGKKYISVARSNKLLDLIILPHEMFHFIFNEIIDGSIKDHRCYYLTEIDGSLANILFAEFFKRKAFENNDFFKDYYHFVFQTEIEELVIRHSIVDSMELNRRIRMNKLNKQLEFYNILGFQQENEICEYLEVPQDVNVKYALSYLAAIDLFYIYQKDPEQAFYLLQNIRYFKHEDDILSLLRRNHITFMDDDYTNLKKYFKK